MAGTFNTTNEDALMPEMNNETAIKNTSWVIRLTLVGGWTLLCAVVWFLWIGSIASSPTLQGPENEASLGMAACMATGCVGAGWFGVLAVSLVIYALVRR